MPVFFPAKKELLPKERACDHLLLMVVPTPNPISLVANHIKAITNSVKIVTEYHYFLQICHHNA